MIGKSELGLAYDTPLTDLARMKPAGLKPMLPSVGSERGVSPTRSEVSVDETKDSLFYAVMRRTLDLLVSVTSLILLSPLMLIIAVLIKLDSPGPVMFRHVRVGRNRRRPGGGDVIPVGDRRTEDSFGRPFTLFKFRSMYVDARERFPHLYRYYYSQEEMQNLPIKLLVSTRNSGGAPAGGRDVELQWENDPRVTPLGRWLRRTSLDELPNFWNVLKGDMHLVGPRPDIAENIRHYPDKHLRKLSVKPGITGLAQVSGRGRLSLLETNEYDVSYADNRSLWLDLKILFRTVVVSIKREGAF